MRKTACLQTISRRCCRMSRGLCGFPHGTGCVASTATSSVLSRRCQATAAIPPRTGCVTSGRRMVATSTAGWKRTTHCVSTYARTGFATSPRRKSANGPEARHVRRQGEVISTARSLSSTTARACTGNCVTTGSVACAPSFSPPSPSPCISRHRYAVWRATAKGVSG